MVSSNDKKNEPERADKLEAGISRLQKFKELKKRGHITFYLDGSGIVSAVELVEKI
jgi:hypothetical protein